MTARSANRSAPLPRLSQSAARGAAEANGGAAVPGRGTARRRAQAHSALPPDGDGAAAAPPRRARCALRPAPARAWGRRRGGERRSNRSRPARGAQPGGRERCGARHGNGAGNGAGPGGGGRAERERRAERAGEGGAAALLRAGGAAGPPSRGSPRPGPPRRAGSGSGGEREALPVPGVPGGAPRHGPRRDGERPGRPHTAPRGLGGLGAALEGNEGGLGPPGREGKGGGFPWEGVVGPSCAGVEQGQGRESFSFQERWDSFPWSARIRGMDLG